MPDSIRTPAPIATARRARSERRRAHVGKALLMGLVSAGVSLAAAPASAADLRQNAVAAPIAPVATPWGGFFVGGGVSFNHFSPRHSGIYATGLSEVYRNGALAATGYATGGTGVPLRDRNAIAPVGQIGYIGSIAGSPFLWGVKLTYNYVGADGDARHALVPQAGGFSSNNPGTTFAGNLLVRQYKVSLKHQFALLPIVGYDLGPVALYAGAGPTLSQTRGEMNGVIGFADINGNRQDITGAGVNFRKSHWEYGLAATAGMMWKLTDNWIVDASYTYARTMRTRDHFFSPFSNPSNGYLYTGVGLGSYAASTVNHAVNVTLNYKF